MHSRKSTQNTLKRGGQNGEYSVKGGFSAENPPFYSLLDGLARQYHNTLSPNILFFGLRWFYFFMSHRFHSFMSHRFHSFMSHRFHRFTQIFDLLQRPNRSSFRLKSVRNQWSKNALLTQRNLMNKISRWRVNKRVGIFSLPTYRFVPGNGTILPW